MDGLMGRATDYLCSMLCVVEAEVAEVLSFPTNLWNYVGVIQNYCDRFWFGWLAAWVFLAFVASVGPDPGRGTDVYHHSLKEDPSLRYDNDDGGLDRRLL